MTPPVWVPLRAIIIIHDRQISRHGGAPGLRDMALLEMGCARPMNLAAYTEADNASVAAAYAFGLSKAHAFVDGNKRTAFVTALTFLRLNGSGFRPMPAEGVRMMEDLASGAVDESRFADWLRAGMHPL
ncbi:type II toxin-antitoxin system death-on-curing family toxin [Sinirhodobacter populi]|uniref:Type II toxin-antitoxin system death-on-curing family toxin n=1 Tax=Paenirhodobacter populi TaxID=2306993 RepID=A0A443KAL9_9RHOB|nr:type II toxin-antitoxin system death-on-curing family toxin [Sinirhodobacter populi]RWR29859.1 type II toxin-antitoxin system death-on-curing family toxin [Sinirhodobacter populi]